MLLIDGSRDRFIYALPVGDEGPRRCSTSTRSTSSPELLRSRRPSGRGSRRCSRDRRARLTESGRARRHLSPACSKPSAPVGRGAPSTSRSPWTPRPRQGGHGQRWITGLFATSAPGPAAATGAGGAPRAAAAFEMSLFFRACSSPRSSLPSSSSPISCSTCGRIRSMSCRSGSSDSRSSCSRACSSARAPPTGDAGAGSSTPARWRSPGRCSAASAGSRSGSNPRSTPSSTRGGTRSSTCSRGEPGAPRRRPLSTCPAWRA